MTSRLGVVGDIVEDVVARMRAPFAPGSDTPSDIVRRRGGSAANMAVAAASLVPTRFFGCVGDDPTGQRLSAGLAGVVAARLQVTGAAPTGTIVVLVDAHGERHMFPDRGANLYLGPIDVSGLDALHATAYSLDGGTTATSVAAALKAVAASGRVTSLDVSSVALINQLGVARMLGVLNELRPTIVFANAAEARLLGLDAREPSPDRLVLVKDGANPALVRTPLGAWLVPTTPLPVTDTTGAGDAFAAGVLASVIHLGLTAEALLAGGEQLAVGLTQAGHKSATARLLPERGHHEGAGDAADADGKVPGA